VKSWTRTLNLDDAHSLLAFAEPGLSYQDWRTDASSLIAHLSADRQREIFRILRDQFLDWSSEGLIEDGPFLAAYQRVPASVQIELLNHHWALSHSLSLIVLRQLVAPALEAEKPDIELADLDRIVAAQVDSGSTQSLRKTRTVLLGALEATGTIIGRGTGQHRSLRAARTEPHPLVYTYLVRRDLRQRATDAMMRSEAIETCLAAEATLCERAWAKHCIAWAVERGHLTEGGDSVGLPE